MPGSLNNRTEQVKGLEAKLSDEKAQRLRAEASIQDKDRELSMMAVDVRQLQYKLDKMDAELRQEGDKCRGALASMERLKEEKEMKMKMAKDQENSDIPSFSTLVSDNINNEENTLNEKLKRKGNDEEEAPPVKAKKKKKSSK